MKRVLLHLEDREYEKLQNLKAVLGKNWKDFVMFLAEYYLKSKLKDEMVMKESLITPYKLQAKALAEIGKLIMKESEKEDIDFYLASLLPLVIVGEDVDEKDLLGLFVLVINVVFKYLQDKYRDSDERKFSILEYMRVATIRELKGDATTFWRLIEEMCDGLRKFS